MTGFNSGHGPFVGHAGRLLLLFAILATVFSVLVLSQLALGFSDSGSLSDTGDSGAGAVTNETGDSGGEGDSATAADLAGPEHTVSLEISDANDETLDADIVFEQAGEEVLAVDNSDDDSAELQEGEYDVTITLDDAPVDEIALSGLKVDSDVDNFIRVDDTPETGDFVDLYAIDPTGLDFESGVVSGVAVGDVLLKCKEWDFDSQVCNGEWVKIADLVPGQEYSFELTPQDPAFAQQLTTQVCAAEQTAAAGSFAGLCDGTYPSACGASGDLLSCNDNFNETHTFNGASFGGVRSNQSNSSITDCLSISSVSICYEWWINGGTPATCDVSVDNDGGASFSAATTTCPGTTPNPGITCVNVTGLDDWQCSNFFGTSGTRALAKSELTRSGGGAANIASWDVLVFNVTYIGPTPVSACTNVSSAGVYKMNQSITGAPTSASPLSDTACIKINSSNVNFDCNGFNITNNGTGGTTYGILVAGPVSNVTIKNCPMVSSYTNGIYLSQASLSQVLNSSALSNTGTGILLNASTSNSLLNVTSRLNGLTGLRMVSGSNNNLVDPSTFCDNTQYGILLNQTNNTLVMDSSICNNGFGGVFLTSAHFNNFTSNNITNNSGNGVEADFSAPTSNRFTGNRVGQNTGSNGFFFSSGSGNTFINNVVFNNSNDGFLFSLSANNLFVGNNVSGSGSHGFFFQVSSNDNVLINNTAFGNGINGFTSITFAQRTVYTNNSAYNNGASGFRIFNFADNATLSNNTAFGNGYGGIELNDTNGTVMSNNRMFSNGVDFLVEGTGTSFRMSNSIFDNPPGNFARYTNLSINDTVSSSYLINWTSNATTLPLPSDHVSFAQKFVNISTLSGTVVIDSIVWHWLNTESAGLNESAFELWKFNSSGWTRLNNVPDTTANTLSNSSLSPLSIFAILVLTDITPPTVTLNSPANNSIINNTNNVSFNFTAVDNQSAIMNCSLFLDGVLRGNNSSVLNNTPTIITVNNVSVGSHTWNVTCRDAAGNQGNSTTFNFFMAAVASCPIISTSGSYVQVADLFGGSNSVSPPAIGGGFSTVCVKIAASNVVYDCNGFGITNDGTNNRIGVLLNGSKTNVTVKNCDPIDGYKAGVYILTSNNSVFLNNTVANSSQDGMLVSTGSNNSFINNTIFGSTQDGIDVNSGSSHFFIGNLLFLNSQDGITVSSSNNNFFLNNTVQSNSQDGIHVTSSTNNTWIDNLAFNNSQDGLHAVSSTINNFFSGNVVFSSSQHGIHVVGSTNVTLINNTVHGNDQSGVQFTSSSNATFINNTVSDNGQRGFSLSSSDLLTIVNNSVFNNTQDGISISAFDSAVLFNNHMYDNTEDLSVSSGDSLSTTVDIFDQPGDGFSNFTNLSITDNDTDSFTVDWNPRPAALPVGCPAFAALTTGEKYVQITNVSAGVSIDTVVWNWVDTESAPYNESQFRVARYNGSIWFGVPSQSTDTGANTVTVSDLSQFGIFAILACNDSISALKLDQTALQPSPGGIVQFNITINNSGDTALNPVMVQDDLPAGLTFSSAFPAPDSVVGQTVLWNNVGPLAAGASTVIYLNATVDPGMVSASVPQLNLTNFVNTTGIDPIGFEVEANSSANVTVFYANVTVVKVDVTPITPVSPGGFVLWNISVTNPGEVTLNVTITDVLPLGFQFAGSSFGPISVSPDNRTIIWNDLASPGASGSLLLNSTVDANVANGTYCNNVNVSGMPPNGFNVTDTDTACVGIFSPAINLVKTVNQTFNVSINNNVTYALNVTNTGSVNLTVTVVDILPPNVTFQSAVPAPTSVVGPVITWLNFIVLPPGGSTIILYNVSSNSSGPKVNNATATGTPPNGANVTDTDSAVFTTLPPPSNDDDDDESNKNMQLEFSFSCPGDLVVFNSTKTNDDPLQGVSVNVIFQGMPYGSVGTDTSGADGLSDLSLPYNGTYKAKATKSGYNTEEVTFDFTTCPVSGCTSDLDCPSTMQCMSGECKPVQCQCGTVSNHSCVAYQCCSDSQCPSGQECTDHKCVPKFECDRNGPGPQDDSDDCGSDEFCEFQGNATGGSCEKVEGCGFIANHTISEPWECGGANCPVCPLGYTCSSHLCVLRNITCPQSGFIGTQVTCNATENNNTCSFCDVEITDPTGKKTRTKTDAGGNVPLGLVVVGNYQIGLVSNDTIIRNVSVAALPKSPVVEPEKPSILDTCPLPWWLLLVLIIIAIIIYWRSRQKGEPLNPGKSKPPAKK